MFDVFEVEKSNSKDVIEGAVLAYAQRIVDDVVRFENLTHNLDAIAEEDMLIWQSIKGNIAFIAKLLLKLEEMEE